MVTYRKARRRVWSKRKWWWAIVGSDYRLRSWTSNGRDGVYVGQVRIYHTRARARKAVLDPTNRIVKVEIREVAPPKRKGGKK